MMSIHIPLLLPYLSFINMFYITASQDCPLMIAAEQGNFSEVQQQLQNGEDPDGNGFWTPLLLVPDCPDSTRIIKLLLKYGAYIHAEDRYGWTALTWASVGENQNGLKTLLQHGANIHKKDRYGLTALNRAGSKEIALELASRGANPEDLREDYGPEIKKEALAKQRKRHRSMYQCLRKYGIPMTHKSIITRTLEFDGGEQAVKRFKEMLLHVHKRKQ